MNKDIIVADANLAVKLLYTKADSDQARTLFAHCNAKPAKVFVPDHFVYEVINVARRVGVDAGKAFDLFEAMKGNFLSVVTPSRELWMSAQEIANDGYPKSGFPSIYDSIYHALSIDLGGVFVTADKRHVAKSSQHGHVCLLKDWHRS